MRVPPFFRRLFKFTSMDFETAVWEMTHLIIAPKKVFRNIYYHVSFTYLLALFCLLAGLAWGIAYAPNTLATLRITAVFVLVHFLGVSLLVATGMYFLVGRVLGRRRRQGLFGPPGDAVGDAGEEVLEFGYCFDVAIRAFLPIWTFLYLLQFLLLPLIARDYWVSNLFGNTMYLLALSYYFVITFLGYNDQGKHNEAHARAIQSWLYIKIIVAMAVLGRGHFRALERLTDVKELTSLDSTGCESSESDASRLPQSMTLRFQFH
ncbi:hypothetical protein B0A54_08292 [Friedmanniomyces endolithicus]|uniref:UNC-50 family protein n=1 Tax=Friedmanniomyces endolithicus TaxID=329885 RepID=A0A4U0UWU3_9PEZI|nr:hypothetical protein B0A54_08292 [Friedmanniomyces endolithicus]